MSSVAEGARPTTRATSPGSTHLADDSDANPVSTTIVAGAIQGSRVGYPALAQAGSRNPGHTTALLWAQAPQCIFFIIE
ncbi:Conserved protein of unknown function with PIN domain, possible antitoxin VapB18 (part 1) [Mycobacterium canettii CIPT 140070017]|nr:Conserved protein of unknown function with PIN domain, possible antitoxin VapB18 (part 1) [Mycobacterium canettii CIPT 140070017]